MVILGRVESVWQYGNDEEGAEILLRYTITCVCSPPYATVVKTTSPLNWYYLVEIILEIWPCLLKFLHFKHILSSYLC